MRKPANSAELNYIELHMHYTNKERENKMSKKIDNKKVVKSEEKKMEAQKKVELEQSLAREINAFCTSGSRPSYPLTGICYKKLPGDKIIITGFYGFLTEAEVKDRYGKDVYNAYAINEDNVFLRYDVNGNEYLILSTADGFTFNIKAGKVMTKKKFSEIKSIIKQCGNYLHELKIAMRSEEKVVGI